jgi:hypothetical protein
MEFAVFLRRANTMSTRELVRLRDRYPTTSRMTQWRMRQQPDFPAGVLVRGTKYFYSDELEAFEESRRRSAPNPSTAETETA